jgi:hypothetical protein
MLCRTLCRAICAVVPAIPAFLVFGLQAADSTAISVSSNGRYFVDGNGNPFFWQGNTDWEMLRLYSVADSRTIIQKQRSQGFNTINVMSTGVPPEYSSFSGPKAWLNDNPLTPNTAFFARTDSIVAVAHEYGMIIVLGVYHSQDQDAGRITTGNARQWAQWLATRYRNSTNIIWSMYPHANDAAKPVINLVVQGIQAGDGGAHIITMHPDPSPTSSSFMHASTWLAFNTVQTYSSDHVDYDMTAADYSRTPAKPVVLGEARYEADGGTTTLDVRHGAYWSILAGGFYTYGHGGSYLDPNNWSTWIHAPGADQMKAMGALFRSLTWWKLVPDQSIFSSNAGNNAAARSSDGDWAVAYLPANASTTIKLDKIAGADSTTAWWMDPTSGAKTKIGTFRTTGTRSFSPPNGWQDAVLLLQKQDAATTIERPVRADEKRLPVLRQTIFAGLSAQHQFGANVTITNIRGQRILLSSGADARTEKPAALKPGIYISVNEGDIPVHK